MTKKSFLQRVPTEYQVLTKVVLGRHNGDRWLSMMEHYSDHKGKAFTSKRLKTLYTMALQIIDSFEGHDPMALAYHWYVQNHGVYETSIHPLDWNRYLKDRMEPLEVEDFLYHLEQNRKVHSLRNLFGRSQYIQCWNREAARIYSSTAEQGGIALHMGFPRGVEGEILRQLVRTKRPHKRMQILSILRGYQLFILDKLSLSQLEKAKASIQYEGLDEVVVDRHRGILSPDGELLISRTVIEKIKALAARTELKEVSLGSLHGTSAYFRQDRGRSGLDFSRIRNKPFGKLLESWFTSPYVPEEVLNAAPQFTYQYTEGILAGDFTIKDHPLVITSDQVSGSNQLGKIHCIQEPGVKARVICIPTARIQYLLKPWHDRLNQLIKLWDLQTISCLHRQDRGIHMVMNGTRSGLRYTCVDLSSATDVFPLALQSALLREIGWGHLASAMESISGPYKGLDGSDWYYCTGQPMGAYSSFPLFHLTHMAVVESILEHTILGQAAVLGDDIVISTNAASQYKRKLEAMRVPVALEKSFSSKLTEFAGFLHFDGYTGKPIRWKGLSKPNPMAVMARFGPKVSHLGRRYAEGYKVFKETLGDRSYDLSPWTSLEVPIPSQEDVSLSHTYLSSLLTQAGSWCRLSVSDQTLFDAFHKEEFALLKRYESLSDMGSSSLKPTRFDPKVYELHDLNERDLTLKGWSAFYRDPLITKVTERINQGI